MRIALFTDTFAPQVNGVTMTLNRLVNYWERKGIEFLVFAPDDAERVEDTDHIRRVLSFPFPLYPECRIPLSRYAKIEKQLLEFKPDLLHLVTPFTLGLIGLRFGQRHNVPMVASYHTNFDQYLDYYRLSFLKKMLWSYLNWFHSNCERTYCPSSATKEILEANGIPNVEIWSRGIDASRYQPQNRNPHIREKYGIDDSKLLLLYVGRMAPEKDIDILLESFHSLPQDVADRVHLMMVGDGPLMSKIQQQQETSITWTGFLRGRELAEMYASCDLFVFPSSTETFGNVALEAMASGLPVVGVEAGGVLDIVTHMKNGLLCHARSVESFREGIALLVRNDNLRLQMAHFARIQAVRRDWDSVFDRLAKSYLSVLEIESLGREAFAALK
ncbi:glycosyltransferase family 4 protein [Effusibacillus lacus]|uniref:Glycosyl transferase n=1 Tax=Effusibacillus lacus TaxID=1348429 RepID=A0A292YH34_9BACL|nr:glycosyltransferase family 1 protein [Effusibacillus lacus]TCS69785.1 glycosyltransferase involved in cell wall biosynthesis [Effusibacillus lacus]GAX88868.1 glycosyl transferase [Effusibacillus lacus]